MKLNNIILIFILIFATLGCAEQQTAKADSGRFSTIYSDDDRDLSIIHDNVNNVTIYVKYGYNECGISAIPDWQLQGPKGNNYV